MAGEQRARMSPGSALSEIPGVLVGDRLRVEVEALGSFAAGLDAPGRRWVLAELGRSITALSTLRSKLLVLEREHAAWRGQGYPTFEAWVAATTKEGIGKARQQVRISATLDEVAVVAGAVETGVITLEHVDTFAKVTGRASRSTPGGLDPAEQVELVELASGTTADDFDKKAHRWLAARDRAEHEADHAAMRRRRFFQVSHTSRGTHLKGFLDPIAGHKLKLALEAASHRPGLDDDREYGQRQADALVDVAERVLNSGELKSGAVVRPHVSFILTQDTYAQATAELARRASAKKAPGRPQDSTGSDHRSLDLFGDGGQRDGKQNGTGPGDVQQNAGHLGPASSPGTAVTLEDGTPVPLSEVARMLCDAELTRIVLDTQGVPVNLGRTKRFHSREQRRAIIHRDESCRFTGCDHPARWCEVHHIDWWDRDQGETSINRGILLCSFHHGEVHNGRVHIIDGPTPTAIPASSRQEMGSKARRGSTVHATSRVQALRTGSTGLAHTVRISSALPSPAQVNSESCGSSSELSGSVPSKRNGVLDQAKRGSSLARERRSRVVPGASVDSKLCGLESRIQWGSRDSHIESTLRGAIQQRRRALARPP